MGRKAWRDTTDSLTEEIEVAVEQVGAAAPPDTMKPYGVNLYDSERQRLLAIVEREELNSLHELMRHLVVLGLEGYEAGQLKLQYQGRKLDNSRR